MTTTIFSINKTISSSIIIIILLFVIFACKSVPYSPKNSSVIKFGMSYDPTFPICVSYYRGIKAAFEMMNREGGILGGKELELFALNNTIGIPDSIIQTTQIFLNDSDIFSLIGFMSTELIKSALIIVNTSNIPLIAPYSGSPLFRLPFKRNLVNLRPTYEDEIFTILEYMTRKMYKFRIALFREKNLLLEDIVEFFHHEIEHLLLQMGGNVQYDSNATVLTQEMIEEMSKANPEAIYIVGVTQWQLIIDLMKFVQTNTTYFPFGKDIMFVVPSFLSTILENNISEIPDNVYSALVVPQFNSTEEYGFLVDFNKIMDELKYEKSPTSLEGFLGGLLAIRGLQNLKGPLTRENYVDALYSLKGIVYNGLEFTLYDNGDGDNCNQALNAIYITKLTKNGIEYLPDGKLEFTDSCFHLHDNPYPPIYFCQSAALNGVSGELGRRMMLGINEAFKEFNLERTETQRILRLVTLDDGYEPSNTLTNTQIFINRTDFMPCFGFAGYVGTPTFEIVKDMILESKLPFIGAFTGSNLLRQPGMENIINVRAGYDFEIASMVQYFFFQKKTRISIFYQDDSFGLAGYVPLKKVLNAFGFEIHSEGTYVRNTLDVEQAVEDILVEKGPEVVIMIGTYKPLAKFVELVQNRVSQPISFATVSFIGIRDFEKHLHLRNVSFSRGEIIVTEVVSYCEDHNSPLIDKYLKIFETLSPNDEGSITFEGYLVGRFILEVIKAYENHNDDNDLIEITPKEFLKELYEHKFFDVSGVTIGPFDNSQQNFNNEGSDEVWITKLPDRTCTEVWEESEHQHDYERHIFLESIISYPILFGFLETTSHDGKYRDFFKSLEIEMTKLVWPKILLLTKNDSLETLEREDEIWDFFLEKKALGVIGDYNESEAYKHVIFLEPFYRKLNTQTNNDIISLRPFIFDEMLTIVKYFMKNARKVLMLVHFDENNRNNFEKETNFFHYHTKYSFSIKTIKVTSSDIKNMNKIETIVDFLRKKFVLLNVNVNDFTYLKQIISQSEQYYSQDLSTNNIICFMSNFDKFEYKEMLNVSSSTIEHWKIYHTNFYAQSSTKYKSFTSSNSENYQFVDFAFLGYITGQLITSILVETLDEGESYHWNQYNLSRFKEDIFKEKIDSDVSFFLGNFELNKCSIGINEVFLYDYMTLTLLDKRSFDCTSYYEIIQFPYYWFYYTLFLLPLSACCVIAIVLIIIRQRKMKQMMLEKLNIIRLRGEIAILFSDIEGSSRAWNYSESMMSEALAVHNIILRNNISKNSGIEVSTAGDSFFIVFSNAKDAIKFCFETQKDLLNAKWSPELLRYTKTILCSKRKETIFKGLRVRMCLHFGAEFETVIDEKTMSYDYLGRDINKTARLESITKGGQINCSLEFMNKIKPLDQVMNFTIFKVGSFKLKGFGDEFHDVFEVTPNELMERREYMLKRPLEKGIPMKLDRLTPHEFKSIGGKVVIKSPPIRNRNTSIILPSQERRNSIERLLSPKTFRKQLNKLDYILSPGKYEGYKNMDKESRVKNFVEFKNTSHLNSGSDTESLSPVISENGEVTPVDFFQPSFEKTKKKEIEQIKSLF